MRFAWKLVLALWLGICIVYGLNGIERYRREATLFETDIQRDHAVMGRGIGAAVSEVWEDEGEERALNILERVNQRENDILIRWVDLTAPSGSPQTPAAPVEAIQGIRRGEVASWTDPEGPGRLYSYVPVRVGGHWNGAIELSETLQPEHDYLRASLMRMIVTFGSLSLVSGLAAMGLGVAFVGRPIRLLVEKARRVGAGDFEGRLELRQNDELGELALEMNTMSARLAEARVNLGREAEARARALDQLRHAERLTTVGKLASGMAHELGTPLNVIQVRAGMIADGEVQGPEARDGARIIREQAERITRIVRQLLDFARRRTPDRSPQDLVAVAERACVLVGPLAKKGGVRIEFRAPERPLILSIDTMQIQQVLTNLLMNGVQAMANGGELRVTLLRTTAPSPSGLPTDLHRCIAVIFEDEGHGMDGATLRQIFDPFFTTKEVGEGTGLGLAVAYGIVQEHGGWILVDSAVGAGTRFTVLFPEPAP